MNTKISFFLCVSLLMAQLSFGRDACITRVIQGVQCRYSTAPGEARGVDDFLTIGHSIIEGDKTCDQLGKESTHATFVEHCWECGEGGTFIWDTARSAHLDSNLKEAVADFSTTPEGNIIWGIGHQEIPLDEESQVTLDFTYGQVSHQRRHYTFECEPLNNEVIPSWQF